jgi:hypothetical protein
MGILDDAIKEHLELKRRRGADPAEVERLEREALGPVRRMAEESSAAGATPSPSPESQFIGDEPPQEEVFDDEPGLEHEDFEDEDLFEEEDTAPHTVVVPPEPAAPPESAAEPDAPRSAGYEDAPPSAGYGEPVSPGFDDEDGPETAEYDVEAEHGEGQTDEEVEESDDMLQETPEFLQDAPEHDRLWFEQRPPRDFDFDG